MAERHRAVVVRAGAGGGRRREEAEEAGPKNETSSLAIFVSSLQTFGRPRVSRNEAPSDVTTLLDGSTYLT